MARVKRICCAADVVDAYDHNIFYYTTIKQLRLVVVKLAKINIGEPKEFNVSVVLREAIVQKIPEFYEIFHKRGGWANRISYLLFRNSK